MNAQAFQQIYSTARMHNAIHRSKRQPLALPPQQKANTMMSIYAWRLLSHSCGQVLSDSRFKLDGTGHLLLLCRIDHRRARLSQRLGKHAQRVPTDI